MRLLTKITTIFACLLLWQCTTDPTPTIERPHSPWVFRSVLDQQPRMITLALHDDVWAAYSTQNAALYKVWSGSVELDGAVYTTAHGPQPLSIGDAWFVSDHKTPWLVSRGGKEEAVKVQYKGHQIKNGQAILKYELNLADGNTIQITEQPEAKIGATGLASFERVFTTTNVPDGVTVALKTNASSIVAADKVTSNGDFKVVNTSPRTAKNLTTVDVDGLLTLHNNGATALTCAFVKSPLIADTNKKADAEEEEKPLGARLIARSDCKTCHNTYVKTVGPSYLDIAKKYRYTDENVTMLVNKVQNGGAGNWGEAAMSAHPDLDVADVKNMVSYIMDLDKAEEANQIAMEATKIATTDLVKGDESIQANEMSIGSIGKVITFENDVRKLADIDWNAEPAFTFVLPNIDAEGDDFGPLKDNFAILAEGYLNIPSGANFVFRLLSDDGSRLLIDGKEIVNHDGLHGADAKDGEVALAEGYHPFRLEYFEKGGGQAIILKWRSFSDGEFVTIPSTAYAHKKADAPAGGGQLVSNSTIPGDRAPLREVHPSYDVSQARPATFLPKVGGLDVFPDGRVAVSTWDSEGAVYIVDNADSGDPAKMTATKIATGLAEPLGLKIVDNEIYIMQKQELTKLVDNDKDGLIDEYQTVCNAWDVTANFHEFGFGLAYKDGHFYATLATGILPGGASALNQPKHRGSAVKISKETGAIEFVANGLRTPNGIGVGVDEEIFIADNQGDWLPSSKIVHISKDAWFGSRSVDFEGTANLKEKLPVVWLPQDEIGNSPTTPSYINDGPYKGQLIHGELTHGGIKRDFVEKVNGEYQGCVFRFIQGLEAGVNRLVWAPDGSLYIGGVGSTGNWRQNDKLFYGLQRLKYNGKSTFEMLAVRAKSNGVEIEFTEPLQEGQGWNEADYDIQQWRYEPTANYGGPKLDLANMDILSVNVSDDRKKVFLELAGMKENHLIYVHLLNPYVSAEGHSLWTSEAWYTMNQIPQNKPGLKTTQSGKIAPNTLTATEKAAGWQLLFDGQTTKGWRNFKKETIGASWKVKDGALFLDSKQKDGGGWQAQDGGDIITDGQYENYELSLEWKIANCGNSGIIFNVVEGAENEYVWHTGPEMQILDNACHPDARIETHRAGDLYDMIACKYETVKPANQWNQVRLIINNGKAEHWLNGKKLVAYEMFTEEWTKMIANSKFKDMPDFGKSRKGHIALQDHGDRVYFRNIKVKEL
ncbi:MAG: family 16 glycoside hydrolase [Saprospiraceae bacterium]